MNAKPTLAELEVAWRDFWETLGAPDYSPGAVALAKHCFMVGQEWGRNRTAPSDGAEERGA